MSTQVTDPALLPLLENVVISERVRAALAAAANISRPLARMMRERLIRYEVDPDDPHTVRIVALEADRPARGDRALRTLEPYLRAQGLLLRVDSRVRRGALHYVAITVTDARGGRAWRYERAAMALTSALSQVEVARERLDDHLPSTAMELQALQDRIVRIVCGLYGARRETLR